MEQHVIFLDVDGTIAPLGAPIPESAIVAIRKARDNGHKVLLCTGRSIAELQPQVAAIGFDGMVGGAGSFVQLDGQMVCFSAFDQHFTDEIVHWFAEHEVYAFYQCATCTYGLAEAVGMFTDLVNRKAESEHSQPVYIPGIVTVKNLAAATGVTKIFFFSPTTCVADVRRHFSGRADVISNTIGLDPTLCGELSQVGISKATGMDAALAALGLGLDASVAVGDGNNDLEMIAHAHVGVAMGNGVQPLKDIADMVTDDILEDGLAHAFERIGLI